MIDIVGKLPPITEAQIEKGKAAAIARVARKIQIESIGQYNRHIKDMMLRAMK